MQVWNVARLRNGIALLGGAISGLLIARLVLKVLAARPDSPTVSWLYTLTAPLVTPLAIIDRDQPRFGAVVEFATVATLIVVISVTALSWVWLGRRRQP
ncbi:YggT family protein [uncultured Chloroflexus sp.]|uniref:YggT family protein n=1 Tax=uncultured Chloroflexus sp. TaxID=214040 RepID=UPI0026390D13|nr:YggT family protein [uncultured Chloroflexus sp.]